MQYLLGVGGGESGGGEHAAGGFDELRLMLLSMGPLLEMDSNMQHDDDSQIQRHYWLPESNMNQSRPGPNLLSSVWPKPATLHSSKCSVATEYDSNDNV